MNTKEITAFIAEELSWKKLYYDKLLPKQKFVCCLYPLCILFGFVGIFAGAISFFDGWIGSIPAILIFLAGFACFPIGGIFNKKYSVFENMVFEKEYRSPSCVIASQVKLNKMATFLGEHNTTENRAEWLKYYKKKTKYSRYWGIGIMVGVAVLYPLLINILKPKSSVKIYVIFFGTMLLLALVEMSISGTRYRLRQRVYNEAKDLLSTLDGLPYNENGQLIWCDNE